MQSVTDNLEQEEREVFKDVMLRQAHLMKVPVKLAVAQSHLRIDSVSPRLNKICPPLKPALGQSTKRVRAVLL